MRSIQSRLGAGLTLSLVIVFLLQWVIVSVALRELSESGMIDHMEHDVDNMLAGLSFDAAGRPALAPGRIEQVYLQPFSGYYFRIVSGSQTLRSRSLWDQDLPSIPVAAGASDTRRLTGPQAQPLLTLTRGFELRGRPVSISIAVDLAPLEADLRGFRNRYALVSGAALVALLLLQVLMVRLSLAPLVRTREELGRLERGELERLDENVPTEFRPLVGELNRLLATLRQRLVRSRQALGNLAHAMKTPLTLLTDLAEDAKPRSVPEMRQQLATQVLALNQLVERELTRARLAGAAGPGQRFDLASEIPALVATLKAIYRDKALDITTEFPPGAKAAVDREDMLELLGNLLDNACKWARARVRLRVEIEPDALHLEVDDDGPGCPPGELPRLTQRGLRLDERTAGHGLGLAIVHDIVASYGGTIEFGRSRGLGGFLAEVRLPVGTDARH